MKTMKDKIIAVLAVILVARQPLCYVRVLAFIQDR